MGEHFAAGAGIATFMASQITTDRLALIVLVALFAGIFAWPLERMLLPVAEMIVA